MKFIDQLYELYKNHLTGDEEDLFAIIRGVFQDHSREDFLKLACELSDEQVEEMVTFYFLELFRRKIEREGLGHSDLDDSGEGRLLH